MANATNPLAAFAGTLPYGSEMFGVYQPLLGWRSRLRQARVHFEQLSVLQEVLAGMKGDSRVGSALAATAQPFVPTAVLSPRQPAWLRSTALDTVQGAASQLAQTAGRAPTPAELANAVATADFHTSITNISVQSTAAARSLQSLGGSPDAGAIKSASPFLVHEAVVAGTMKYLAQQAPSVLQALALGTTARWQAMLPYVDPLSQFDVTTQQAYLSPIGMIHLYREYFFELESFLGPPVGHVWVSPGGSLEVYEVHTTRQAQERTTEQTTETHLAHRERDADRGRFCRRRCRRTTARTPAWG